MLAAIFRPYHCSDSELTAEASGPTMRPDGSVVTTGVIRASDGQQVGSFRRRLSRERDGSLTLHNENLELDEDFQGRGFGSALHRVTERRAAALGIARAVLHTMDVGGYAWARAGYQFHSGLPHLSADLQQLAGAGAAAHLLLLYRGKVDRLVTSGNVTASLADEFTGRFATPAQISDGALHNKFTTPAQIAAFGNEQRWSGGERPSWLGREFMLGSAWSGVRDLRETTGAAGNSAQTPTDDRVPGALSARSPRHA